MTDEKKKMKDDFKDYDNKMSDGSNEISERDLNMDIPCHKEITLLTPDMEFCPVCGFYIPKK